MPIRLRSESDVSITQMIESNLPAIARVDWLAHEGVTGHAPWSHNEVAHAFKRPYVGGLIARIERFRPIVAFCLYELAPAHRSVDDAIHLLRFAVDPAYQRQGIGTALLMAVCRKLITSAGQWNRVSTLIPETCTAAAICLRANGFLVPPGGLVKAAFGGDTDGYLMTYGGEGE